MRNLALILIGMAIAVFSLKYDELLSLSIESYLVYILSVVAIADYFLGVSTKIYSNSVIELLLRSIGRLIYYAFNLKEKGFKLDKRNKRE